MKKRLAQALVASVVISSLIITPVLAAPSEDELKEKKATAESEVGSLQKQLGELISKMKDLEVKLGNTSLKLSETEEDLEVAEEKQEKQYEDMKLRIQYMYEESDASAFEKLATSGSISEMLSQIEYVAQVHTYDRDMLTEYENTVKEVEAIKTELETEQKKLEGLQADYEVQKEELDTTIESKRDEIADLDDMLREIAEKVLAERAEANPETPSAGGNQTPPHEYDAVTGNAVVDRAYQWLGASYVWGACSPGAFDCSGFVSYCLTGNYVHQWTTGDFINWPQVSDPQPGDVCVVHNSVNQHTGIYIGNGKMIHASTEGVGVVEGSVQAGMIYVRP